MYRSICCCKQGEKHSGVSGQGCRRPKPWPHKCKARALPPGPHCWSLRQALSRSTVLHMAAGQNVSDFILKSYFLSMISLQNWLNKICILQCLNAVGLCLLLLNLCVGQGAGLVFIFFFLHHKSFWCSVVQKNLFLIKVSVVQDSWVCLN